MKTVVVALGGNALQPVKEKWTYNELAKNINNAVKNFKGFDKNYRLVICHGNGPQVGEFLIEQKIAKSLVPQMPLHVLDAFTQGQLGYLLQMSLRNQLGRSAVSVITQILIDKKDTAFNRPTKPIGPYYRRRIEKNMVHFHDGWRRVVPSPKPKQIIEIDAIRNLIRKNFIVIAGGGGGIPVIKEHGIIRGVDAVIDKDLTAQLLASSLKADSMILLTGTDYVYANYKEKRGKIIGIRAKWLNRIINNFEEGTIRPKLQACVDFIEKGGKKAYIGNIYNLKEIIGGVSGTRIL